MIRSFYDHSDFVVKWLTERVDYCSEGFGKCVTMGFVEGDKMVAGVVFSEYRPDSKDIRISIATDTPKWATKRVIREILSYPFKQLECGRLTAVVAKRNKKCRKMLKRLGFVEEGNVRKGFVKDDAIIYGMLREEAEKWL